MLTKEEREDKERCLVCYEEPYDLYLFRDCPCKTTFICKSCLENDDFFGKCPTCDKSFFSLEKTWRKPGTNLAFLDRYRKIIIFVSSILLSLQHFSYTNYEECSTYYIIYILQSEISLLIFAITNLCINLYYISRSRWDEELGVRKLDFQRFRTIENR